MLDHSDNSGQVVDELEEGNSGNIRGKQESGYPEWLETVLCDPAMIQAIRVAACQLLDKVEK